MAKLCIAGIQLREQIDDDYPDRDRKWPTIKNGKFCRIDTPKRPDLE